MKIEIEWELTEEIGVEFIKESYITLREQPEQDKDLIQSFNHVLYYLMVQEKAYQFICDTEDANHTST